VDEVSICGYYRPHRLELGTCGAHFVGVNGRNAAEAHGHWDWKRYEVQDRLAELRRVRISGARSENAARMPLSNLLDNGVDFGGRES
jgi:hypothetical protein